ncbi:hypothetical protein [Sphingomonas sp. KR3-1]|uniref:hypothetical protein n=1 Tax=Sphingomonas sp. KR3-1 TaxID=3156611 RepID=UPI0032B479BA
MLPLALVLLLGVALAFQALVGNALDLPAAGAVRGGAPAERVAAVQPARALVDPVIAGRAMFTPILAQPKEATAAAQAPLGGFAVVGAVQIGASAYAIVQGPDRAFRAAPGQRIGDWRVRSVTRDAVQLSRGGERMQVRFGIGGPVISAGKGEE